MIDVSELAEAGTDERRLVEELDLSRMPRHVAVIMDGNGRWAGERRLPRVAGHRAGIESVRDTLETAARLGLEVLTLYAFSQENWKRPRAEVETLMTLLSEYARRELESLTRNNIRLRVIGRMAELPESARGALQRALDATAANDGMEFNIALSYGGRTEIVDACKSLLRERVDPESLDVEAFAARLTTAGQPDPDLLIRTSGELRISNFLLWQIAYSEIWVTETLWPDFRKRHFLQAIVDYQRRERRYGGVDDPHLTEDPAAIVRS